ncbi:MAG: hypothetical protein JXQ71_04575 [Verrucomicrobia bacterium]|nr:hypothetical protein [Verrucomicrobiota bacterium]
MKTLLISLLASALVLAAQPAPPAPAPVPAAPAVEPHSAPAVAVPPLLGSSASAATNPVSSTTRPVPVRLPAPKVLPAVPGAATSSVPGKLAPFRRSAAPAAAAPPVSAPAEAPPRAGVPAVPAAAVPAVPGALPPGLPPGAVKSARPGAVTGGVTATNADASVKAEEAPEEQIIPAGQIKFEEADLAQVLTIYQELTGLTVLRPTSLPQATVTLYTATDLTRREAVQALDSILSLNGISMVPQGTKFVKALATAEAPQAGQIFYDADPNDLPEAGQYISYIARVKYASLEDVTAALQPFASKAPNSIMGIKSTQTLILRDNAENVKRMLEIIREIDVYVPREYKPVVIPIKYALAADIAQVLSTLTSGGGGVTSVGGGQGVGSQRLTTPTGGVGGGLPTASSGSRVGGSRYGGSYGGSYGSSYGGYGGYGGSGGIYQRSAGVVALSGNNPDAWAAEADRVMPQASFQQKLQQIVNKASGEEEIVVLGQTKIIADERTNSLLVFASDEDIEMINDIVAKLDVVLAQVLIEAVVLEVSLTDNLSFGVSALQHPGSAGQWKGVGGYRNDSVITDPWSWLGGDVSSTTNAIGGAILPNMPSGFSYFAKYANDLDIAVQAIAGIGNVKVLSRPRVQTSHAVPCRIFVGETRPYVTGYGYGGYGGYSQSQIAQLRIGIELNVLPLINPDGLVVMDIDQRVDNVGENVKIDNNDVPTTVERSANAKVSVRNGETVILGGFIRNEKRDSNSGVPFLKDIPLLGYLFKSTSRSDQRVELMILIRPFVLQTPEEAAIVALEEKSKMPGISKAERAFTEDERKAQRKAAQELYKREGFE